MKKVIFLLISIVYSLSSIAQQTSLNEMVSIRLPKGAEKLNKEQTGAFVNNKFGNDKVASNILKTKQEHVYLINDILVSFNPGEAGVTFKDGYLLEEKRGLDAMAKLSKHYTSVIKSINNNQVLLSEHITKNVAFYHFSCINNTGTRSLSCRLQFDKADTTKASSLLDDLLQNIMFTK